MKVLLYSFIFISSNVLAQTIIQDNFNRVLGESVVELTKYDNLGNYYICGEATGEVDLDMTSSGKFNTPSTSFEELFIAKYNVDTNELQWGIVLEGNNSYSFRDIDFDSDGNIYVTGFFKGTVDFDPGVNVFSLSGFGASHTFIAKYDSMGNLLWANAIGNGNFSVSSKKLSFVNDKLYISGFFTGETDFDPGPGIGTLTGSSIAYFLELDKDGNFLSARNLGGRITVDDIDYNSDGSFYMSGIYFGQVDFGFVSQELLSTPAFSDNGFLAKYDRFKNLEWIHIIESQSSTNRVWNLDILNNGNVVITGTVESETTIGSTIINGDNNFAAVYNSSGTLQNVIELYNKGTFVQYLLTDSKNNIYVSSGFDSPLNIPSSDTILNLQPEDDLENRFLMMLNPELKLFGIEDVNGDISSHAMSISDDDQFTSILEIAFASREESLYALDGFKLPGVGKISLGVERFKIEVSVDQDMDGYSESEDCDDMNDAVNPGETEIPYNGIDDDCDPTTLDDDLDMDSYVNSEDCDDSNAEVNPGQTEIPYNGIDDDCNDATLDDDLDMDSYVNAEDCNDMNDAVNPGQTEIPYNGIDDDCNDATLDDDLDMDSYVNAEDCDDTNADVNPGETEIPYNGLDDDCDTTTLDDDLDMDGFDNSEDCDDTEGEINPDAVDDTVNGVDENCDGVDGPLAINELDNVKINIYPNPVADYINIEVEKRLDFNVNVYNLNSELVYKANNISTIDVRQMESGIYYLILENNKTKNIAVEQIIISN